MPRKISLTFSPDGAVYRPNGEPGNLSEILNIGQDDSATVELIGATVKNGRFQSDSAAFNTETTLELLLPDARAMVRGRIQLAYDGEETAEISLNGITSYEIGIALNALPGIHALGGVNVYQIGDSGELYQIIFRTVGATDLITVTHSEATMTGRVTESVEGTGSLSAVFTLDLRVQKIASQSTWTALSAATVAASQVVAGTSTVHQHDRITLSRPAIGGDFSVSCDGGDSWTDPISIFSGAYDLECALGRDTFRVERSTSGGETRWDVIRVRAGAAPTLQVRAVGINSLTGLTGTLDFSDFKRALALTDAAPGELMLGRLSLRTGPALSSGVLTSGVTLLDSTFAFRPAAAPSPIALALEPS